MRKLLNSLFVMTEESYLTLDGENIVVMVGNDTIGRFPLHTLENILCFSYKGASPALMGACANKNIGLSFFTPYGKFLARIVGEEQGNVLLRMEQYRISDSEKRSLCYSRNMIIGKIYNCRWSIERTIRDHSERVNVEKLRSVSAELQNGLVSINECCSMDSLRGLEGQLAARYFSAFDELIINQKEDFIFEIRNRRPPLDRVNAALSFAYTLVGNDCANALRSVGLDPYVGFMHGERPGRKSLSLDILEEFRGIMADRFVLTMINTRAINKDCFSKHDDGAVMLNDKGRKIFLKAWQNHKKEKITHPFLKEKVEWGLVPYIQALLLARTIRGDLEEYPPFLWK